MLGDDVPNDELNVAWKAGLHFGFPFCHQGDVSDPQFGAERACSTAEPPVLNLGAARRGDRLDVLHRQHVSRQLQERGDHRAARIVEPIDAERLSRHGGAHGRTPGHEPTNRSWTASSRKGAATSGEARAAAAMGRPVDVLQMPDGSILISDDSGNRLIRVSYGRVRQAFPRRRDLHVALASSPARRAVPRSRSTTPASSRRT